jgi:hypothetical protein
LNSESPENSEKFKKIPKNPYKLLKFFGISKTPEISLKLLEFSESSCE